LTWESACDCSTAPDGSYSRAAIGGFEKLMKDMGNQPHTLRANAIWDLPDVTTAVIRTGEGCWRRPNGWQLRACDDRSGIPVMTPRSCTRTARP
jgi:hypothetical protein